MNFQPITIVLLALVAGIATEYFGEVYHWFFCIFALALFLAIAFSFFYKKYTASFFTYFSLIFFFVFGILLTHIAFYKPKNHFENCLENKIQLMRFSVEEVTHNSDFYRKYYINIQAVLHQKKWQKTEGKALLKIKTTQKDSLRYGEDYVALLQINEIHSDKNPLDFQYNTFLKNKGIYHEAMIDSLVKIENNWRIADIKNIKMLLAKNAEKSGYNKESQEILRAITFGDRSDMSFESIQRFSRSGIIHILAISGMHIVLIFQAILWLINGFSLYNPKRSTIIFCLSILFVYAFIIGFQPSVLRAVIMLCVYYGFILLNRTSNSYHTISLAALLILLYDPLQLFDVGFQLSFTAVFFMVWLHRPIYNLVKVRKKNTKNIVSFLSVTLAAQLGTLPLSLYYFHQYSLWSLFVNILVIPLSGLLIIYSFVCVFQVLLFPEVSFLATVYNAMIATLHFITKWVSEQEYTLFTNIPFSWIELVLLTLFMVFLRFFLVKKTYKNALYLLGILVFFQTARLVLDEHFKTKKELVVFHQYHNSIIGYKEENSVYYFISDSTNIKLLEAYTLKPFAIKNRIMNYETFLIPKNTSAQLPHKVLYVNKNWVVHDFNNKKILIISNSPFIDWKNINKAKITNIVFDSYNFPNYVLKQTQILQELSYQGNIWYTKEQGAFIKNLTVE